MLKRPMRILENFGESLWITLIFSSSYMRVKRNLFSRPTQLKKEYAGDLSTYTKDPHEKLLGTTWVSNPATIKDLAARNWGVFWYQSKSVRRRLEYKH